MKLRGLAVMLTALTVTSSFGVITGTLAWFAYTTRAQLSFSGTTIHNSEQLQVGFTFENDDKTIARFKANLADNGIDLDSSKTFEKVEDTDFTYFFVKPGESLTSAMVMSYSKALGYSTNYLIPVTSREYTIKDDLKTNDDLTLNRAPTKGEPNLGQKASDDSYSYLNLAFRVLRSDNSVTGYKYMQNRDIWLQDATTHAGLNLEKSLRIFVNSDNGKFILNPNATEKGSTTVAGLLNMDYNDDYYDYDPSTYFTKKPKELIYGDYELKEGKSDNATLFENDSALDDINQTNSTVKSSFLAKHQQGLYCYQNYDSYDLKKAMYYSMSDIKADDKSGYLTDGVAICTTSQDDKAIATVSLTIYLEGWDHSITDQSLFEQDNNGGTGFDLGLTFQTNRVD